LGFSGGLADTDAATVIDNRGEQAVFSDGPFVESKEYLAGVWVWEAPDLDVALKLATEASKVCDRKIECDRSSERSLRSEPSDACLVAEERGDRVTISELRGDGVSGACGANRQTLPRRRGTSDRVTITELAR